jgi:hypothetical protein
VVTGNVVVTKANSRFPAGMTTRKARTRTKATAKARARKDGIAEG